MIPVKLGQRFAVLAHEVRCVIAGACGAYLKVLSACEEVKRIWKNMVWLLLSVVLWDALSLVCVADVGHGDHISLTIPCCCTSAGTC